MAAFVPTRRDPEATATALARVREDKQREAADGFDGSWVAHPDLVEICEAVFDEVLGSRPNQLDRSREDVKVTARQLLDVSSTPGAVTEAGLRTNVSVALQYLEAWLRGTSAVAIDNLMEDTATAEISRAQVWQWRHAGVVLDTGERVTGALVGRIVDEELAKIRRRLGAAGSAGRRFDTARQLFEQVALGDEFVDFLTVPAYRLVD
jgi:malate synthase